MADLNFHGLLYVIYNFHWRILLVKVIKLSSINFLWHEVVQIFWIKKTLETFANVIILCESWFYILSDHNGELVVKSFFCCCKLVQHQLWVGLKLLSIILSFLFLLIIHFFVQELGPKCLFKLIHRLLIGLLA